MSVVDLALPVEVSVGSDLAWGVEALACAVGLGIHDFVCSASSDN